MGYQYNAALTLQALSYFDDLRGQLTDGVKKDLERAVRSVSLQKLPVIAAKGTIGEGIERRSS